jgi:hypothetical protein
MVAGYRAADGRRKLLVAEEVREKGLWKRMAHNVVMLYRQSL